MALENPFKNLSKPQLYAVVGGGTLITGFIFIQHHKSTGSWNPFSSKSSATAGTTSAGTATSIDPVTGLAYSEDDMTDPITGLTYLAEAEQYGSVATADSSVSAYGASSASGSGIPVNPASPVASGSVNSVQGSTVYTSNAAWAQAVEAGLTDVGYSSTDVASALGAYLTQQPVDSTQANIISVAIAEYGNPPVGNLQIITEPASKSSTTTTGTSPSTPVKVQVPDVKGDTIDAAEKLITAVGLKSHINQVLKGGTSYYINSQTPGAGTSIAKGSTVDLGVAIGKPTQ
jgi:hypothetical protein